MFIKPFLLLAYVLSSLTATLAMTVWSYLLSYLYAENFKEPALLNMLWNTSRILPGNPSTHHATGWAMHVSIGLIFLAVALGFFHLFQFEPRWSIMLVTGVIAGIVAILGWQISFRVNPDSPAIGLTGFYIQLFIGHVIFMLVGISLFYHLQV